MYHYHKRIHDSIPIGQNCDHGCQQPAKFKGTGAVYTCQKNAHHCPAYLERHSNSVKQQWVGADERRASTKQKFLEVVHSDEIRDKTIKSIKARAIVKADDAKSYRSYARKCRKIAQQWAKDNGHDIGRYTHHVDHRLSLVDAFYYKLDVAIASHPANLQILPAKENSKKQARSEITLAQLLLEIQNYNANV